MKKIQIDIIELIQDENVNGGGCQKLFEDHKIPENANEFKLFLYLLSRITNNYHRNSSFFTKIDRIFLYFKEYIKQTLSNHEIFNIFKRNKRIILFFIKENIMIIDKSIADIILSVKYSSFNYRYYLYPELKNFLNDKMIDEITKRMPDDFEKRREKGENHFEISEIIRSDLLSEFIEFVNKRNISLNSKIESSIFETNVYLIKNQTSLIEYTAFFGSINIFKFLVMNGIELKQSLWIYAIHGGNAEMIHLLEEKQIENKYDKCLEESIKCHHNELSYYFINNFNQNENDFSFDLTSKCLKYYNFSFIKKEMINKSLFFELCKYDYFDFVQFLIKTEDIDINSIIISIDFFYTI